jgi:DNA-directed RNA polymerase beta' subunit
MNENNRNSIRGKQFIFQKATENQWGTKVNYARDPKILFFSFSSQMKARNRLKQIKNVEANQLHSLTQNSEQNREEQKKLYTSYSKFSEIQLISIGLASSQTIRHWAEKRLPNGKTLGEVTSANTLHHKKFQPLKGGLFCERIFGPMKDFECACGKRKRPNEEEYKKILEHQPTQRKFCPICDVEYTWSIMRRYQMGYIKLSSPVSHVWYLKANPSYLSILLDMKRSDLEHIIYCSKTTTLENSRRLVYNLEISKSNSQIARPINFQTAQSIRFLNDSKFQTKQWKKNSRSLSYQNLYHYNFEQPQHSNFWRLCVLTWFERNSKFLNILKFVTNFPTQSSPFELSQFIIQFQNVKKMKNKQTFTQLNSFNFYPFSFKKKISWLVNNRQISWKISNTNMNFYYQKQEPQPKYSISKTLTLPLFIPRSREILEFPFTSNFFSIEDTFDDPFPFVSLEKNQMEWNFVPKSKDFNIGDRYYFSCFNKKNNSRIEKKYILSFLDEKEEGHNQIRKKETIQNKKFEALQFSLSQEEIEVHKSFLFFIQSNLLKLNNRIEQKITENVLLKFWKIYFQKTYYLAKNQNFLITKTLFQNFKKKNTFIKITELKEIFFPFLEKILAQKLQTFHAMLYTNVQKKEQKNFQTLIKLFNRLELLNSNNFYNNFLTNKFSFKNSNKKQVAEVFSKKENGLKQKKNFQYSFFRKKIIAYIQYFLIKIFKKNIEKKQTFIKLIKYFNTITSKNLNQILTKFFIQNFVYLNKNFMPENQYQRKFNFLFCIQKQNFQSFLFSIKNENFFSNKNKIRYFDFFIKNKLDFYLNQKLFKKYFSTFSISQNNQIFDKNFFLKNSKIFQFLNILCNPNCVDNKILQIQEENKTKNIFQSFLNRKKQFQKTKEISRNQWSWILGPYFSMLDFNFLNKNKMPPLISFANQLKFIKKTCLRNISISSYFKMKSIAQQINQYTYKIYCFEKSKNNKFSKIFKTQHFYNLELKEEIEKTKQQVAFTQTAKFVLKDQYAQEQTFLHFRKRSLICKTQNNFAFKNLDLIDSFFPIQNQQKNKVQSQIFENLQIFHNKNPIYYVSYRHGWSTEESWKNFSSYALAPKYVKDLLIPFYKNRFLNNLIQRPSLSTSKKYLDKISSTETFAGASIIQKFLSEFHSSATEFQKIDKQNRIFLYEFYKIINILKMLANNNLAEKWEKKELKELCQKRDKLIRRTKIIRKFLRQNSTNIPSSMILTVLPVLPPDLRPILKIQDQIAASDLNRLYQRVIYRNDRLHKFRQMTARSTVIENSFEIKYAQRLLQEAVDNLIQNGKGGTADCDARGRPLKSLSDILKGKQGRFRQHLLGKRVDYSGRSVIVVGPKLKIHECGLPKEMALELFLPFLIQRIVHYRLVRTVIGAKTLIQTNPNLTYSILSEIMQSIPIFLNRAPTLHRLGIQAFQPKLIEGRAILLHPLVCPAFNADFDGDQMAVHIPLTVEARAECWKLMFSRNHLISSATGDPIMLPSQDMVLGCYYLTTEVYPTKLTDLVSSSSFGSMLNQFKQPNKSLQAFNNLTTQLQKNFMTTQNQKNFNHLFFNNFNQVLKAYQCQKLSLHSLIWVKWNNKMEITIARPSFMPFLSVQLKTSFFYNEKKLIWPHSNSLNYDKQQKKFKQILQTTKALNFSYPLEIRIQKFGHWNEIRHKQIRNIMPQSNNPIVYQQYIRTTPGRILFYQKIQRCLSK